MAVVSSRLQIGDVVELRELDLFSEIRPGRFAPAEQGSLFRAWDERLEARLRERLEEATENSLSVLDVTEISQAPTADLVRALRGAVAGARPRASRGRFKLPRRCAGWRYVALRWLARRSPERMLRDAVLARWRLMDIEEGEPLLLPLVTERGLRIVGDVPERMAAVRDALTIRRMHIYESFAAPGYPTHAKALGREALNATRLGLVAPREFATRQKLESYGLSPRSPNSRPRLLESVLAAAGELVPRN